MTNHRMSAIASPAICRRPAMNTLFEIVLAESEENQIAAAEAALDEVQRIESVLSRFDPASEVFRVNREAAQRPVLISFELMEVLKLCREFWKKTGSYFDPIATSARGKDFDFNAVVLDEAKRTLYFSKAEAKLDFGAFGKGFALDHAAGVLKENGVSNALLHGGTSSVLALEKGCDNQSWQVGVRHPRNETEELTQLKLLDQGFSTSATFRSGQSGSDILNPLRRSELTEQASCSVIAPSAAEAEVFSTAFLSMGKMATQSWLAQNIKSSLRVLWIDAEKNSPHWLS
jgi:thiamine biosynthesis lipoprotein